MPILLRMFRFSRFMALVAACLLSAAAFAGEDSLLPEGKSAQLPVPRFVTLGTDEVNLRTGPGLRYPIRLVVRKAGLPVEVVREFDVWRQVRDAEGDEGWVLKSMLSGKRAVVVRGSTQILLKKPDEDSKPVAKLEPGVVATLKSCESDWCEITASGFSGWMKRGRLWGVYPSEKFGGR